MSQSLGYAVLLAVSVGVSASPRINYPSTVLPQHHDELNTLRSKTDFAKLASVLEERRERHSKDLDGEAKLLIAQIILRARAAAAATRPAERDELANQALELAAVYSTYSKVALGQPALVHPFFAGDELSRVAERPPHSSFAANLADGRDRPLGMAALERHRRRDELDPRSSAFWNRVPLRRYETYDYARSSMRRDLCSPDLVYEFDDKKEVPETGGGRNPGYKLTAVLPGAGKTKVSAKLAMRATPLESPLFYKQEAYVEATANSLYRALGYNVDDSFFCPTIKIRYHADLLELPRSPVLDRKVWNFELYYDRALLADGTSVPFAEAIRSDAKDRIAYLTTHGVSLEAHAKGVERLLAWRHTGLSHEDRRELRALPVFDTWIANLDNFGFNLKLGLVKPKERSEQGAMRFLLVDTGMSFSPQYTILPDHTIFFEPRDLQEAARRNEYDAAREKYRGMSDLALSVNGFSWSVFREGDAARPSPRDLGETERMSRVGQDLYYFESRQVQRLLPYMTWEDLRWATRKIAALSEEQLLHAACLSGLGYPGARLLTEKLVARRDQLVQYFGLEPEVKLLRPKGPDTGLTVTGDGVIKVRTGARKTEAVKIPSYGYRVEKGVFHTSS